MPFQIALVVGPRVTPSCRAEAHRGDLKQVQGTHESLHLEVDVVAVIPELGARAGA